MPRFVIHKHAKRKSYHFDLMLESDNTLKTWSFFKPLKTYNPRKISAVPIQTSANIPDHRKIYLAYEGKISRGRGRVTIWDRGIYQKIIWRNRLKAIMFQGNRIAGMLVILHLLHRPRLIPLIHSQPTRYTHRGQSKSRLRSDPKVLF